MGVSASPPPPFSLELEAAEAVWGPSGSDTEGVRKIKVAKKRGGMSVEDKDNVGNDKSGSL